MHCLTLKCLDITWTSCETVVCTPEAVQPLTVPSVPFPYWVSLCSWPWLQAPSHHTSWGPLSATTLLVCPVLTSPEVHKQDLYASTPENQLGFCISVVCFQQCSHVTHMHKPNRSVFLVVFVTQILPTPAVYEK